VLVGDGAWDADRLVPWERADIASLVADPTTEAALPDGLQALDAAIVYSRSRELASRLARSCRLLLCDPAPDGTTHASWHFARPLGELGLEVPAEVPRLAASARDAEASAALLARLPAGFLALHPGSGSRRKRWPCDSFERLAEALSPGQPWLLVEGPADAEAVAPLRRDPRAVVASGWAPRPLGALLARAGAFVGNDSGVSHLAAAFGAPTLALFGPTDPRVWAPVGPRVAVVQSRTPRMEDLSIAEVLAGAKRLAAAATSRAPGPPCG
jgi:ADP-heptose:LPS heptosyltransferase